MKKIAPYTMLLFVSLQLAEDGDWQKKEANLSAYIKQKRKKKKKYIQKRIAARRHRKQREVVKHAYTPIINEEQLPAQVKNILDKHSKEVKNFLDEANSRPDASKGINVQNPKWLPNYFIKYGVKRFFITQRIKRTIEENNLNLLTAPEKYLYHVPGQPYDVSSKNYLVIAKKEFDTEKQLTPPQAQQLVILVLKAKLCDVRAENYVITKEGKVIIIDTGEGGILFCNPNDTIDEIFLKENADLIKYQENWQIGDRADFLKRRALERPSLLRKIKSYFGCTF